MDEELARQKAEADHQELDGELASELYDELRRLAVREMAKERPSHTLQATALVHEAWLRVGDGRIPPGDRARFYCAAATAMRRVLLNHARDRARLKRGAGAGRVELDLAQVPEAGRGTLDLLELEAALARLEEQDPRKARLVELLYFAGLDHASAARALGFSVSTLKREWTAAKAWLSLYMQREG